MPLSVYYSSWMLWMQYLTWVKILFHVCHHGIPLCICQCVRVFSLGLDIPIELMVHNISWYLKKCFITDCLGSYTVSLSCLSYWPLTTYGYRWKVKFWYWLCCGVEWGQNWVLVPFYVCLWYSVHFIRYFYTHSLISTHINRQDNAHNDSNSNYDNPDNSWGKEIFTSFKYVVHAMQAAVLCVRNCSPLQRILKVF